MEYEVLEGIDFSRLDVLAILVDVRPHNIMSILELLLPAGFVFAEAMSLFNKKDNLQWDGPHQDYLFCDAILLPRLRMTAVASSLTKSVTAHRSMP